ncbi:ABC transporter substrate-binding protein [Paraburkholderia caribensis]|uniref:ABC transporter substrate-binding protein n=1 Tax=Paraburkholderia caribensis TaxID=75105 RepID=A0A9Q6S9Z4_9BURK|nr:ABC transporter substrate-binding protein [Paraburkholderia caribensis]MCO4877403.1 ABC transporter substrate-binding protein [Paraburkholderia caribensis]PTB29920.1 amino acid ABC transporter substrate-binding protein [Paraburkholderia caribensis]QLB67193.1 ABC transporter substrate-binding protein [Paraburkholderia caribensis]
MKAHIFTKSAHKGLSHTMKIAAAIVPLCMATHANVAAAAGTVAPESLQIGADLTYPPYDYLDNGTPAGFDPAFMGKLATHLKLKPSFVDTRFANLILGVNANRFDVIASALYVTPERAKQIDFLPYLKTGGSLLALSGAGFAPKTPEDLCGKRVSSIKGASWIPKLADVSGKVCVPAGRGAIDVREFETSPEAAQAVLSHAVDAQFEDSAVAQITANRLGGRVAITSTVPLYPVVIGLGVKKGNDALLSQLKTALASMKSSGEYAALLKQYNVAEPTGGDIALALGSTQK